MIHEQIQSDNPSIIVVATRTSLVVLFMTFSVIVILLQRENALEEWENTLEACRGCDCCDNIPSLRSISMPL